MARDVERVKVLYGEVMPPSPLPEPTSVRNNIATRVNIKTAVLVAAARSEIGKLDDERRTSALTLRSYENDINNRIEWRNKAHKVEMTRLDIELAVLEQELAAIKGVK